MFRELRHSGASERIVLSEACKLSFCTPDDKSYWFGYYNYSPISRDGRRMLAHHANFEGRMPNAEDRCSIGYFDLADGCWHQLATSSAFNWQQGSMLQWLGPDFNTRVIYNDAERSHFVSRILSVDSGQLETVPEAIYAVDPAGSFSITLNFERCYWMRAYSYATIRNEYWNKRIPKDDGLFRVDLQSGKKEKIIALEVIIKAGGNKDDGASAHWLEHIQLNPSGTRVAFYHRSGNNTSYITQLYTADITGDNLWRHPMQPSEQLSHMNWRNPQEYVVFSGIASHVGAAYSAIEKHRNYSARMAVWIYRKCVKPCVSVVKVAAIAGKSYYALTQDQAGIKERWGCGRLCCDGHPGFTQDGRFMLTDTYADEQGFRHLMVFDTQRKKLVPLAKLFSSINNCGWRADLHPRFSPDEKKVIVDGSHNGRHQMVVLELDWARIRRTE
jgi:hypothetical protein